MSSDQSSKADVTSNPPFWHLLIANAIRVIHIVLVAWVAIGPFLPWPFIWDIHLRLVVFLLVKWWVRFGECTLTVLEQHFRGVPKEHGFIYSCLQPVIDMRETQWNRLMYIAVIGLGFLSWWRLSQSRGK